MNIHGIKLRVQEAKDKIKEIEIELSDKDLSEDERKDLIRQKTNLIRKKNTYKNTIKSMKQERRLKKSGRK